MTISSGSGDACALARRGPANQTSEIACCDDAQTATVTTACPKGHQAISWGVGLPVMEGNAYSPSGITNRRTTPWVSASAPKGSGWSMTFRTADGRPAAAAATVTSHVTCAVPA